MTSLPDFPWWAGHWWLCMPHSFFSGGFPLKAVTFRFSLDRGAFAAVVSLHIPFHLLCELEASTGEGMGLAKLQGFLHN